MSFFASWLREQHAIPGAVNALFAPRLGNRIKLSVGNPLFAISGEISTPNQSFRQNNVNPLLTSTPHSNAHGQHGTEEETIEYEPADFVIKNPLFGSGLHLQKVCCAHIIISECYFIQLLLGEQCSGQQAFWLWSSGL